MYIVATRNIKTKQKQNTQKPQKTKHETKNKCKCLLLTPIFKKKVSLVTPLKDKTKRNKNENPNIEKYIGFSMKINHLFCCLFVE